MKRSSMTIPVLLAAMACNRGSNTGDTDFGTTDDFSTETDPATGTAGPMTATEAMSSTMTAGMTADMTDTATQGDDMMATTESPADSTGGAGSSCIVSGQYIATLVGRDDPHGHFSFLQLFYSSSAPDNLVDEEVVVDVAEDGTLTIDFLPRDSEGSGHSGVTGLVGTLGPQCEAEIAAQAEWESMQGSFGTIDIDLSGVLTHPDDAPPSADLTFSGGSIPNGPITYNIELVPP